MVVLFTVRNSFLIVNWALSLYRIIYMAASMEWVFILLIAFQFKHFICDFPLQREYMLKKTLPGWAFIPPLALHCAVHASFTLAILMVVKPTLWYMSLFDFAVHFTMDRLKASPKYLGRYSDRDKSGFWNCLGFDQMVHHCTHYYIIWAIVQS